MSPSRDKNERKYRGGEGTAPVSRARPVKKAATGTTSHELGWKVKVITKTKQIT